MGKIRTSDRGSGPKYFGPMGIISVIFIGLIVGAVAKFLMPGKDPSITM